MTHLHSHFFRDDEYLDEFRDFFPTVIWSDRNPLNTEMFFLWSMIRATKPELFIESGTYRGYSANFICEALVRNDNGAEFISFGFNLDDCLPFARQRLEAYPFATVVEGDSREHLGAWARESRETAFFIDGPKGQNMPPLFFAILRNFANVQFVAVHDCQKESGSRNRQYVRKFFGGEYLSMFCDSGFQDRFSFLDQPLIGKSELVEWKPYHWNGVAQESYGTETGYVMPILGKTGSSFSRLLVRVYRHIRFRAYPAVSTKLPVKVKSLWHAR